MTKAKTRLLLNHPFFAILLLKQIVVDDPKIKTASVDGKHFKYNSQWFETLDNSEQMFLLAHEVMHLALEHHLRRGNRDIKKWNDACDYAINLILVEAGLKLPKGGLFNLAYRDKTAEEIYTLLPQGQDKGQNDPDGQDGEPTDDQGQGISGFGDVLDYPDASNAPQEAVEQQNSLIEAYKAVEGRGHLPGALKRFINEILNPKLPWYQVLEYLRSEKAAEDYSYRKGNRKYMHRGIIVPVLENQTYTSAVIAIDTSGSIHQEELNKMLTEVQAVSDIINNLLYVIYCDAQVQKVDEFEPGDLIISQDIQMLGGGGTDFIPPFDYVDENDIWPKLLLYFTDGQCNSFPEEPDYDVVWLCTGTNFNPPFGDVIYF